MKTLQLSVLFCCKFGVWAETSFDNITGYKSETKSSYWPSKMHTLWIFLSLLNAVYGQQDGIQTIFGDPTYSKLRPCAQRCFHIQLGSPVDYLRDVLGSSIGCPMVSTTSITSLQVAENNCFCRTDLQPSAQAVITQCVLSRCKQNQNDAATAGAMYSGYCSANGYYAAAGGGRQTSAAGPSPTANTATPGAVATGSRSSPTGPPGTSSASSPQRPKSAVVIICLVSMVSCFHRSKRRMFLCLTRHQAAASGILIS